MKYKCFFKVIAIVITLAILLILGSLRTTEAQTYVTVSAKHDLDVESDYEYFSIEYRATAYFEIKLDIEEAGGEDVEIILAADENHEDVEVDDDDTFIYYIGDDAYSSSMSSYDTIGTSSGDDITIPHISGLFLLAAIDEPSSDWATYEFGTAGGKVTRITVTMVAAAAYNSRMDIIKIREYTFEDNTGDDHDDSQDFSDYYSLSDADWDRVAGAPVVDTSDDTLYLCSSYLGYCPRYVEICDGKDNDYDGMIPANEADKDMDGFMICEGDCDDSDYTVYPGASGTYKGKDNNCNGTMDEDEKKPPSYLTYTPVFPSWTQYQQLWRLSLLPMYTEQQKQNWYHYQSNHYQQILIQTLNSGGEFCPFFAQPYWYQSYSYSWLGQGTGSGPTWTISFPWQIPIRQSTFSSSVVRYRSPVHIRLTLDNPSTKQLTGLIKLELYNLNKKKISSQMKSLTIEPARMDYPLTLQKVPENMDTEDFVKYNLNYSFSGGGISIEGQKSLFDIADKLEVRVVGPDSFHIDQQTPVRVHAFVHGRPEPVKDATVTVYLLQGDKTYQLGRYKTNNDGLLEAPLNFSNNTAGAGKLRIKVSSPFGSETIEEDIEILRLHKILLTTDKPIYQPGQTIYIRTLTLRRPDLLPEANKEIIIECEDPKGNKVFRVNPETDMFGVASADFVLGTDINLGLYTLRAICTENDNPVESVKKVNVERYVLPKFKVDLETDAEFYSPGDTVIGTIHAGYFFGKHVSGASVTIEASKFDVEFVSFQTITGQTDEEGFFSFELTLPDYFVGLPLEQGGALVKLDIKVTDTAEHQETIVRELTVTGGPIIVRMIPESGSVVPGVENIIYILTTDPRGHSLQTTNLISFDDQTLSISTDDQGAGSFTFTPDESSSLIFNVTSQANGQSVVVNIDLSDSSGQGKILLRTDNAIYKTGDTMTLDLYTPELMARRVFVDVIRDHQTILTKGVDIIDGHGRLFLDISNDMAGTILLEAYYISEALEMASDIFRDKKVVYVNPVDDVQVTATLDKDEYLPGEKARIEFQVIPPQTAALGITIVDEAVYALQENRPGLVKVYFSMEEGILKPSFWSLIVPFEEALIYETPDEKIQEMVEIVFASAEEPDDPGIDESGYPDLIQKMKETVVSVIASDAEGIVQHLRNLSIYDESDFETALSKGQIKTFLDPWDNPYELEVGSNQFIMICNGPDGKSGNIDDISYTQNYYRPYSYYTYYSYYTQYSSYSSTYYPYSGGGGYSGGGSSSDSGFLTPAVQEDKETPGKKEETQEPRKIRRDFPETLLWEPLLITDQDGTAYLDTNMADSITTWRMSIMASTLDGKLGGSTDGIVVFQNFFIDLDLPVTLTQKDEISLPVAIYNYLDEPQTVRIVVEKDQNDQWFVLMGPSERVVNLEPKEITSVYFRIKGMDVGWHELTVFGYGTQMSDAIARSIEVLPDGKEFHVNISDRLTEETSDVLHIPRNAIDGASKIMVKIYPGIFSQVVEGLEKMLKVPYG